MREASGSLLDALDVCPICGNPVADSGIRDSETKQGYHFLCWATATAMAEADDV